MKPLRAMRPPLGVPLSVTHREGIVQLKVEGKTHRLDATTALSLADQLHDSSSAAETYWATRPRFKAPKAKPQPAPEAQ